jgi:hypothetical protein
LLLLNLHLAIAGENEKAANVTFATGKTKIFDDVYYMSRSQSKTFDVYHNMFDSGKGYMKLCTQDYNPVANIRSILLIKLPKSIMKVTVTLKNGEIIKGYQYGARRFYLKDASLPEASGYDLKSLKKIEFRSRSITLPILKKTTTRVPEKVQKDERKYKLFANTQPDNTIVRILNIKRTFKQGVELKPGKYHIEVAKNGYETKRQWIEIKESDLSINIELNELKKEDIFLIDVLVEGIDDGVKTSKRQDRDEALIDAKRQAIERAGVDVSAITIVEDFKLKKDWIESKAKAILIPGFQIIDKGYQNDGTYLVILSGKVKSIL